MREPKASEVNKIVDHLFRHIFSQLLATLTRFLGTAHIDLAESVVQEAFFKACQSWPYRGIPENPSGWLTTVAKNTALDMIRREKRFREKEEEIVRWYESQRDGDATGSKVENSEVIDDQLRMMFTTCHPCLSRKSQVTLTLKLVGGFSVGEIARAFLSNEEATRKLLTRAKQKIRDEKIRFELPPLHALSRRVDAVLEAVYLIFNEGYSAYQGDILVRQDFCDEAIRLSSFFLNGSLSKFPKLTTVKALLALMLLHSSRVPARMDKQGNLVLLADQDRSLWDKKRINLGLKYLQDSATGTELSKYHLEAHIAAAHAVAPSFDEADWQRILDCYNKLLRINRNPVVALNRAVALSMVQGVEAGLHELTALAKEPLLKTYYLLPATFADFHRRLNDNGKATEYYKRALSLVGNTPERHFLEKRLHDCLES